MLASNSTGSSPRSSSYPINNQISFLNSKLLGYGVPSIPFWTKDDDSFLIFDNMNNKNIPLDLSYLDESWTSERTSFNDYQIRNAIKTTLTQLEMDKETKISEIDDWILELTRYKKLIQEQYNNRLNAWQTEIADLSNKLNVANTPLIIHPNVYIEEGDDADILSKSKRFLQYLINFKLVDSGTLSEGIANYQYKELFTLLQNDLTSICRSSGEKGTYYGQVSNNKANGICLLITNKNETYVGTFKDNQIISGKKTYPNGELYEGSFVDGLESGSGIRIYSDGKYIGDFKNGKRNGKGKMIMADATSYEGDWKDDYIEGKGVYTWYGGSVYKGEFIKDERNGYGWETYSNGDSYEGQFLNNIQHGFGVYYSKNGDKYYGHWTEGIKTGNGVFYDSNKRKLMEIKPKKGYYFNQKKTISAML